MPIRTKRAYIPASDADGDRYLIDRLWPRGVSREALRLTAWRKELSPSDALRRWFQHEPTRFAEFRRRYLAELSTQAAAVEELRRAGQDHVVTLVYAARDGLRCNAAVLSELLSAAPEESRRRLGVTTGPARAGARRRPTASVRGRSRAGSTARGPRTGPRG